MFIIDLIKAIILGIVEGVTEWLPISSTGHLILVQEFLNFKNQNQAFISMFNVVIQLGAILAVVVIYFNRLNPFQKGKTAREIRITWQLWAKVVIAVLPAIIIGLPLDDWMEEHLHNFVTVALMLIFYGFVFLWIEQKHKNESLQPSVTSLARMSYKTALFIGLFQVLSLVPGTSRSGITIIGGMLLGTSRVVATEFTFFLGIPVMFGASFIKVLKFILGGDSLTLGQFAILAIAMLTAFVVSMYAIRFLTDYVKKNDFTVFGKYRIVLGLLLLLYAGIKVLFL
ncbi:undecaprenyl-diphosphate phosphatase [Streptococcus zalophi]|uniref:Undecaprenyl-diphosphatase n=1 Tax=Streptococcus zalophi TaxID=640031 RepID=A0A934PA08_9STRE|nr:undecaprenyl-diphosphate phosphatase [Streptococcus zalophi]MBJ8349809.1 undecaprenyl-diphosphate phosphatase [Streptococcus zalophi]